MKRIAMLFMALAAYANAAFALDCAAPLTQKDMNECAYEGFLDASRDYASSYKTLGDGLSAAQKKQLLRMQKSWMAYRTQACDFESSASQGGSVQAMVKWQCMTRMTKQRAGELDTLSRCPEGDVSCVQPTVKVYKASGSTQCNPGSGTPVKVMLDQFAAANIPVRAMGCGTDGAMRTTVCGAPDGAIRIFEVSVSDLNKAAAQGFLLLGTLPEARETPCY